MFAHILVRSFARPAHLSSFYINRTEQTIRFHERNAVVKTLLQSLSLTTGGTTIGGLL